MGQPWGVAAFTREQVSETSNSGSCRSPSLGLPTFSWWLLMTQYSHSQEGPPLPNLPSASAIGQIGDGAEGSVIGPLHVSPVNPLSCSPLAHIYFTFPGIIPPSCYGLVSRRRSLERHYYKCHCARHSPPKQQQPVQMPKCFDEKEIGEEVLETEA